MFRRLAGWAVIVVVMSNCAVTVGPGLPMKKKPERLAWCPGAPTLEFTEDTQEGGTATLIPDAVFRPCQRQLLEEMRAWDNIDWSGDVVLGLSTDDTGHIQDVCLWGGTMGDTVDYAECTARAVINSGIVFSPNLVNLKYRLHFVYD